MHARSPTQLAADAAATVAAMTAELADATAAAATNGTLDETRDVDSALRERRAMLDLELRLLAVNAQTIHEKHQLHATPHYSRSLHMLSDAAVASAATSGGSTFLVANATGGYREKAAPIESLPLITQLDSEEHVRQKVAQRMDEIVQVQTEPPLSFALDTYLSECTAAGTLRNDSWSTLQQLLHFQSHYLSSLEALNYQLVARFLQHAAQNSSVLERYGARFSHVVVSVNKQYEKMLHRFQVLRDTYITNITDAPKSLAAASYMSSLGTAAPVLPLERKHDGWERAMTKGDFEDYLRYTLPRQATRTRSNRFLLKLRWLHAIHERDLVDAGPGGLWSRTRDLSEPPFFHAPRAVDILPHNLTRIEDVDAENRRLQALWLKEAGLTEEDTDEPDRVDVDATRSLNPFAAAFTTAGRSVHAIPQSTVAADANEHLSTCRTHAPPSIFDSVSRTFPRVFDAQARCYSLRVLKDYAHLLDEKEDAAALELEYAAMNETEIMAHKAQRTERILEQHLQEARAKHTGTAASADPEFDARAARIASGAAVSHMLRDSTAPIISSTGKIWGGKAINNFRIRDEREVETVLANAEAAQGGDPAPQRTQRKDSASSAISMPLIAREDDSGRVPDAPLSSFTFAGQKQADMLSDPSRMIGAVGKGAGGIDKKMIGPSIYLRKANFLRRTRIFANVPEYLVTQRQVLLEHGASTAVDHQLHQHFEFVVKNDRIDVFHKQAERLVSEHLSLLEAIDDNGVTPAASAEPTKRAHHGRKSSLVMMDGEVMPLASAAAIPSPRNVPDELSHHVQVEIEIPAHKLQALYMLRVLRLRELRARILSVLNYLRSMHKTLVADEVLYEDTSQHAGNSDAQKRPPHAARLYDPVDILARASSCSALEDRADEWRFDPSSSGSGSGAEHIHVHDARKKVRIVYDAAVSDLTQLETELLALASIYIERHHLVGLGIKGEADTELAAYQSLLNSLDGSISTGQASHTAKYSRKAEDTAHNQSEDERFYTDPLLISSKTSKFSDSADRWSVLVDLFEREFQFLSAKRGLMDVYFEAYAHTTDKCKMRALAQRMVDLLAYRPHFDLDRSVSSFAGIYTAEISVLHSQAALYREVMYAQLEEELMHGLSVGMNPMSGSAGASASSSSASAHAAFDWSLFSAEPSMTPFDALNTLSAFRVCTPALAHPLRHPHTLFEMHQSFDVLEDVASAFEQAVEKVEATLPVPRKKVLNIYLVQVRQKVIDNALHCFRSHIHEESPFPPSQHFTTLDFLESSPFFRSAAYASVKLHANFQAQRDAALAVSAVAGQRRPTVDQQGNILDGHELQLYLNYLEVLDVRSGLLATMYESILLTRLYFAQAERLGVEAPRTMLDMHASSLATAGSGFKSAASTSSSGSSYLLSSGSGEVGSFAASEVFGLLPPASQRDLFRSVQELERAEVLADSSTLQNMRSLLELQRMQTALLETTLAVHATFAASEELTDAAKKAAMELVSPSLRQRFRPAFGGGGGTPGATAVATAAGAPTPRPSNSVFVSMIANIKSEASTSSVSAADGTPQKRRAVVKPRAPVRSHELRGCLTSSTFVDLFALKLHARERLEALLASPAQEQPQSGKPLTVASTISMHELLRLYVREVLHALAPEVYVAEVGGLIARFREIHAGAFGAFSPFMAKFKMSGTDGFLDHLTQKKEQPTSSPPVNVAPEHVSSSSSVDMSATGPHLTSLADSALPSAAPRWGGGGGAVSAMSMFPAPTFGSLFQIPSTAGLLALLQLERGVAPIENLRLDALCRKTLYDTALLSTSLAQLEFLPTLSFSGNKVAELTSSRLDVVRNDLREMDAGETMEDVFDMLSAERRTVWTRLLAFVRCLTEALLVREDVLGLEYVTKVVRIVRCELVDPAAVHAHEGGSMLAAPLIPRRAPWQGGAACLAVFDPFSHPLTALHRLSSYFLYWCDRRVLSSFEGLAREQAALAKYVYRMSKVDPTGQPEEVSAGVRAERTASTMRGALVLAQMFDAFYTNAFALEAAAKQPPKAKSRTFTAPQQGAESYWSQAKGASLANPHAGMFTEGSLYMRALEVADCNLIAKVNELRRREGARQRGAVPLAFLSILERTSNQCATLMAAASAHNHAATSLQLSAELADAAGSVGHITTSSTALHAGALNSSAVFGFTLFALGLRLVDQEMILGILRDQLQFDLFAGCVAQIRGRLETLQSEEIVRTKPGGYAHDLRYSSLLQSSRLLISEVQDTSYEMNVIKEWLASSGNAPLADGMAISTSQGQKQKFYYVLNKETFNKQLSQLLRDTMVFGDGPRAFRLRCVDNVNGFLASVVAEQQALLTALTTEVESQVSEYTAQSLAQVTDAQYKLIIDLQSMREQRDHLHTYAATEQEHALRTAIESEYEARVHRLSMQILSLHSKLDINNITIRQRILTHYYNLKKNTLEDMIKNGSAPYLIKRRALKVLSSEARYQETKLEYSSLHSTSLRLHTLFSMKDTIQARMFAKEEHEMRALLSQHELLLGEIAACEARAHVWAHETTETKNTLMLCHKHLEELQSTFLAYRRENAKLHTWKRVQLAKLAKLELITRKFEDVTEDDFEKLELDMRARAEEMDTALQYEKNADLRQKLSEAAHEKKLRQIRRLIMREERLITEAHNKIHAMSVSEGPAGGLDPTHDQQQNDYLWEQRCLAAEKKATILRAENARLRAALSGDVKSAAEWQQAQQLQYAQEHAQQAEARAQHQLQRGVTPRPPQNQPQPSAKWKR